MSQKNSFQLADFFHQSQTAHCALINHYSDFQGSKKANITSGYGTSRWRQWSMKLSRRLCATISQYMLIMCVINVIKIALCPRAMLSVQGKSHRLSIYVFFVEIRNEELVNWRHFQLSCKVPASYTRMIKKFV